MLIGKRWLNLGVLGLKLLGQLPHLRFYPDAFLEQLYRSGPSLLLSVLLIHLILSTLIMHLLSPVPIQSLGAAFALIFGQQIPLLICSGLVAIQSAGGTAQELFIYQQEQQLEFLKSLPISFLDYVVIPRMFSSIIMLPLLVVFSLAIGFGTATLIVIQHYGYITLNVPLFWNSARSILSLHNLLWMLLKSSVLGGTIALVGCTWGLTPLKMSDLSSPLRYRISTYAAISAWGIALFLDLALSVSQ